MGGQGLGQTNKPKRVQTGDPRSTHAGKEFRRGSGGRTEPTKQFRPEIREVHGNLDEEEAGEGHHNALWEAGDDGRDGVQEVGDDGPTNLEVGFERAATAPEGNGIV
ncbi:hypothetical protein GOODEAATRI_029371 [Goodea atripinnis]|uniref:Uncharacterized protein n=1 Tax=Goodea atripinnis TaxID=208336 RepID=A0ABV0PI09_9TELE